MAKWLDKYDAPQAQNGIEGTMGGLTDKGFNYNGAWGGPSMQMGGNIMPAMAGANQTVPMAQKGTRQPIYTSDPRDPRLKRYQDSLSAFTKDQAWENFLRTVPDEKYNFEEIDKVADKYRIPAEKAGAFDLGVRDKYGIIQSDYTRNIYAKGKRDKGKYWSPIVKKPVQPVVYKKRELEKPGKVDLPEQIQFKDLPQPRGGYKSAAPELQMISETPTKYSYTYPSGNQQKTIYFPSKSTWKAFIDQFDGLNTTERAGSFEATPGVYTRERRPNPVFKNLKFQMGGVLPGAVGFTYARTAGAAPANGPYAKKTKASAQNGQEMKYYQEGLDFKPKTISKNGGWLDKYDAPQARDGDDILDYLKKGKPAPVVTKGKPLTAEQQKRITAETLKRQTQRSKPLTATNTREQAVEKGRAENLRVIEENKEYDRQAMAEGKAAEATRENPNVPFTFPTGESKLWKDMDWRERQYVSGRNLGSMSRSNNWTDWINPITMIGEMGEGLATAPYMARVTESNLPYVAGIASPLLGGALGGLGTRSTGQFANNMLNPVAGIDLSFNKIGEKITNAMLSPFSKSTQSAIKSFDLGINSGIMDVLSGRPISETFPITKKQIELAKQKATQEHAQGSKFARDWYYDSKGAIRPEVEKKIESILKSKGAPLENYPYYPNYKTSGTSSYKSTDPITGKDSYHFITNPFADSPDVVVGSSTKSILESGLPDDAKKYLLEKRHKIGGVNFVNAYGPGPSMTLFGHGPHYYRPSYVGDIGAHEAGHTAQNLGGIPYDPRTGVPYYNYKTETWGEVTASTSPDHEYYIPNPNTEIGQRFGKAMIEPKKGKSTWAASPNELHSELMMARLRTHKNLMKQGLDYQTAIDKLQKETMTDDAMVDELIRQGSLNRFFKKDTPIEEKRALIRLLPAAVPAVGAASMLGGEEEKPKRAFQDGGGIPVDPMGYWNPENVGGPVIIPSNVITMEGVDQPLLGISDTGDVQYMIPGEDYEFDGEYVTEYPVAQGGKRVPIQTSDPADPRLHSYLDSLNLNKAYLAQRRINPEVGVRKFVEENLARILGSNKEKYIAREQGRKKTFESLSKAKQAKFFKPGQLDDAWTSEAKFKKDVPEDAPLIDVYKGLTFSSPTETGLWTTPDLYNANIAPVDIYFGGKGTAAYNPVFMAPVQPIEYTGDPADYMKYRSSPTIHGSKQKFNPKLKLSQPPAKEKPQPKQEVVKKPEAVRQKVGMLDMFGKKDVELLVDNFGNYEWFRKDDDIGDLKPIRRATREEIEYSKKQKQRNGGVNNADAQPLKKLDQLLNFTNYNKPTKGGWLDKYN